MIHKRVVIGGDGAVGEEASASPNANALTSVLVEATSHPNLFAFSQFLALPNLLQLQATENSVYLDMLRLFAHGTWSDYKSKHVDNGFTFYFFNITVMFLHLVAAPSTIKYGGFLVELLFIIHY
ncbi:COP9 signalosome complex subunit 7 [Glycine soja]